MIDPNLNDIPLGFDTDFAITEAVSSATLPVSGVIQIPTASALAFGTGALSANRIPQS